MNKLVKSVFLVLAVGAMSVLPLAVASTSSKTGNETKIITLSKSNLMVLDDAVTGESVAKILKTAKDLTSPKGLGRLIPMSKSKEPLYLYLFTPGGEIQSGLELVEGLKGLGRPVNTITSFAASMGFQLVQNLDQRYILKSGILMSHHARGGAEGEIGGQGKAQLNQRLGLWERRLQEMDEQTVARTNGKQTLQSYQAAYDHELWATGKESVEQGYADKVVVIHCDESLSGYSTRTIQFMMFLIDYDISDCPLGATPVNIRPHVETNKGKMTVQQFTAAGGTFGAACLQLAANDPNKVCALDTTLSFEKINFVTQQFVDRLTNPKDYIIPMQFK